MFVDAQRTKMRLLMAIIGPAGSGKTVSGLKTMHYLLEGEPFYAIDTENGRMRQYAIAPGEKADPEARRFNFKVAELSNYDPRNYMKAIDYAVKDGAKGIFIDSLSHAWAGKGGILDQKNAKDKRGGNSFTNWGEMTQLQNELIEMIMQLPCHVIVTMRAKNEYVLEVNDNGKSVPRKVGLAPVQRDDVEYNFDIVGMMNMDHAMTFVKDTSGLLEGKEMPYPGIDLATILIPWLNTGARIPMTRFEFITKMKELGYQEERVDIAAFVNEHPEINGVYRFNDLYELAQNAR